MRFFRFLAIVVVLALIAAGLVVAYAVRHQTQLVRMVLAQIDQRTGLNITISGARLAFRSHVIVVLERPRVSMRGREVARLAAIRAILSYRSIIHRSGLPLYALILDRVDVKLPGVERVSQVGAIPQIGVGEIARLSQALHLLSDISYRYDVNDATLASQNGGVIASNLDVTAYRRHRRSQLSPWLVSFDIRIEQAPASGVQLAGDIWLDDSRPEVISSGRIWFWDVNLDGAAIGGLQTWGHLQGSLHLVLHRDAELSGAAEAKLRDFAIGGNLLNAPINLGEYSLRVTYNATAERLDVTNFLIRQNQLRVAEGSASIINLYSPARAATFSVGGMSLKLTRASSWLRSIRRVPPTLIGFTDRFRSGEFTINEASLAAPQPVRELTLAMLCSQLNVQATLTNAAYVPPPDMKLPPVNEFSAALAYSAEKVHLTQGTGRIGGSSIADLDVTADMRRAPRQIPYRASLKGQIDVGELYAATRDLLYRAEPRLRGLLEWIHGHAPITVTASDSLRGFTLTIPHRYVVAANLGDIEVLINNAPDAIVLKDGKLAIQPGKINVDRAVAVTVDEPVGSAVLNGSVTAHPEAPLFHNFTAEFHQIDISKWLPMFVDPDQLSAIGPLGGKLVANGDPAHGSTPIITGDLTLGSGSIQFGFLRSPMLITRSATLSLDGRGLVLDIPSCRLEGAPLDFRLAVADLGKPALQIDAKASRLDFEVMRFIRLPWSPKTAPHFFPFPAYGHLEASEGNFAKLAMTDISTDFSHDANIWRVSNFSAKAFGGTAHLDISGSGLASDDWINIKGGVNSMDAAPLFMLAESGKRSPLIGKLNATADVWANTDTDFFSTLAGNVAVELTDGTLNRFKLLTRILSLIDLKNWLTAQVPDPRVSGIPFKTLTAEFKGKHGDFYTDNLRLDGTVMDITAKGNVQLADGRINMEVGLIPFNTVNWIVNKIPIIGANLAGGSNGLLAAYFQVHGPISNPKIVPKPITSVAEFVIKALSLPINIIKPNTIK